MQIIMMAISLPEPVVRQSFLAALTPWGAASVSLFFLLLAGLITAYIKAVRVIDTEQIRERAENGSSAARSLLRRLDSRDKLNRELMTAFILAAAAYFIWGAVRSVPALVTLFTDSPAGQGWVYAAVTAVHILLFLMAGKSIPERAAGKAGGLFARKSWYLLAPLLLIVRPVERFVYFTATAVLRLFRIREVEDAAAAPTEEEFLQMLEDGRDRGAIVDDNIELFANLFDFDDKTAADVMTHRTEIEALPVEADYETTLSFVQNTKYTRFPVFRGSVDNIIGVLHVKDLLFIDHDDFSLGDIMRQAWFTPESRIISDLFHDMQQRHIQMAIVIDEYGGTAGLLTIEDLVEQIVGNIEDEYDEVEQEIIEIGPHSWLVAGSYPLDKLSRVTGVTFADDDYDSVAGFVIELLDRIPEEQERPSVRYGGLVFHVLAISDNRIVRVRVTRELPVEQASPGEAE
ncbi:MAG TPA: hemolysin family protein [Bacillota bacterium]|nr:hemolysin family protein [Bacillota bacterium]